MRTIISTVGTSLLGHARQALGQADLSEKDLRRYLHDTDPAKAAAESNCLSRILKDNDALVFVCSETAEGRVCAAALAQHFAAKKYPTSVREISRLNYEHGSFRRLGLRNLVSTLTALIRESRQSGRSPVLNATGGFKAEIAYATTVGLLFDVPVYYIHEAFQDVVELPPTPVAWDYGIIFDHEEFFDWLNSDLRPSAEYRRRASGLPAEVRALVVEEEGFAYLSPTGEALVDAYRETVLRWQFEPIYMSGQALERLNALGSDSRRAMERFLARLRLRPLWITRAEHVHGSDCLTWPKGHVNERIFFHHSDGVIRVCEIALHSDGSYERLLSQGVWTKDYTDFVPWTAG